MFTGIVTHLGTIRAMRGRADRTFEVAPAFDAGSLTMGASVAHAGVCLTVTGIGGDSYEVMASAETLARTTLGSWEVGREVNLERSLRLGDELGGHLVFGHVDAVGGVLGIEEVGSSRIFTFSVPDALAPLLAVKGSVAVDGVSLTVTAVEQGSFSVMVIPHTYGVTTLGRLRPGDRVNLEADMLARYVARQLGAQSERNGYAG